MANPLFPLVQTPFSRPRVQRPQAIKNYNTNPFKTLQMKKQNKLEKPACHEVQIHYKRPLYDIEKKIKSSKDVEVLLREFINTDSLDLKEYFWVMVLTNAHQVIGISKIGAGDSKGVIVNFKEIFQLALLTNATAIIVAHNHPSGKLKASSADIGTTKKLSKALRLLDIELLDHLIITSEGFLSLSDEGLV